MSKRGQIPAQIFLYVLSIVIVSIILVIGYNYITTTKNTLSNAELSLLQKRLTTDIKTTGDDYGTFRKTSYSFPGSAELCLFDLSEREKILESELINFYPLIKDSIESGINKNAFIVAKKQFESFDVGDITLNHYPHFKCFEEENGKINLGIEGRGDKALILSEFISSVSLDSSKKIELVSADDIIKLVIPAGTTADAESISIEIVDPGDVTSQDKISDIYKFEPSGTTFSQPIELLVEFNPNEIGECPDELVFTQHNDDGSIKAEIPSKEIDCENNIATFEIDGFSYGYIRAPRRYECLDTDMGINYFKKGVIHYYDEKYKAQDSCSLDGNQLTEYYCEGGQYLSKIYDCPNGCVNGACLPAQEEPYCGDGNLDLIEECDDGNNNNGDGCSADCIIETCSDTEQGKDYYTKGIVSSPTSVAWSDACVIEFNGQYDDTNGCNGTNCYVQEAYCCSGDLCQEYFQCPNGCQDGACVPSPETCTDSDDGRNYFVKGILNTYYINSDGTLTSFSQEDECGTNGQLIEYFCVEFGGTEEEFYCEFGCQDGACLPDQVEPFCGDGNQDSGEQCDDNNTLSGDGCSSACQIETCSEQSGFICSSDQLCLGTSLTASDTYRCCDAACVTAAGNTCDTCGDGLFNVCDEIECYNLSEGCFFIDNLIVNQCNACAGALCESYGSEDQTCQDDKCGLGNCGWDSVNNICVTLPYCGDGNLDSGEECDDGNNINGDGCSADCVIETCAENWQCTDWSICQNYQQIRTCTDTNNCGTTKNKPLEEQSCATTTEWIDFSNPQQVNINGYNGHAMEPFISRDGQYLFFNNLNDPSVNTNLYYATRIDDNNFQYQGEVSGVNTAALEAVASLDELNNFFFMSTVDVSTTQSTAHVGNFAAGTVTNVQHILTNEGLGGLIMGNEVSPDGNTLYFVISNSPYMDLSVANKEGSTFVVDANWRNIMANVNLPNAAEYAPSISSDGLELFFTRIPIVSGIPDPTQIGTYRATRTTTSDSFGVAEKINAITGFAEGPTITKDGKTLYYHNKDATGKFVIYKVTRQPNDTTLFQDSDCQTIVEDMEYHCPYHSVTKSDDILLSKFKTLYSAKIDGSGRLNPIVDAPPGWEIAQNSIAPNHERLLLTIVKPSCPKDHRDNRGRLCSWGRNVIWSAYHDENDPSNLNDDMWVLKNLASIYGYNADIHGWTSWQSNKYALMNGLIRPEGQPVSMPGNQESNNAQAYQIRFDSNTDVHTDFFGKDSIYREDCLTGRLYPSHVQNQDSCVEGTQVVYARRCYSEQPSYESYAWWNTKDIDGSGGKCTENLPTLHVPVLRVYMTEVDTQCQPKTVFDLKNPIQEPRANDLFRHIAEIVPEWGDMMPAINNDGTLIAFHTVKGYDDSDPDDNCGSFRYAGKGSPRVFYCELDENNECIETRLLSTPEDFKVDQGQPFFYDTKDGRFIIFSEGSESGGVRVVRVNLDTEPHERAVLFEGMGGYPIR